MKYNKLTASIKFLLIALLFIGCEEGSIDLMDDTETPAEKESIVAVANRADGSISFIDATTNTVTKTLEIEDSEPMYTVYVAQQDKLYVGDRKGNKVYVINPTTKSVESSIAVGKGVFHMWAGGNGKQLWVNNDIDKSISVIDLTTNKVVKTIMLDLKPHDVFISKDGTKAYVSVIDAESNSDRVLLYSTETFKKVAETNEINKDPHLFYLDNRDELFVACQSGTGSGTVYRLNGSDLSLKKATGVIGAHGIYGTSDEEDILITSITGAGLYSLNIANGLSGGYIESSGKTPHNIVINESGDKMFVTHSGANANTVSTYSLKKVTTEIIGKDPVNSIEMKSEATITVGSNPFGLTYYSRN